jgi:hypothetical protein
VKLSKFHKVFKYDPKSGIITWRISQKYSKVKVGQEAGYTTVQGYIHIEFDGKTYKAHRLAWFLFFGKWPTGILDHIDRNKANNAIDNLREATLAQNTWNSKHRKDNKSGFRGVTYSASGQNWKATVGTGEKGRYKQRYLGVFQTKEEASAAYEKAAREIAGEFLGALRCD